MESVQLAILPMRAFPLGHSHFSLRHSHLVSIVAGYLDIFVRRTSGITPVSNQLCSSNTILLLSLQCSRSFRLWAQRALPEVTSVGSHSFSTRQMGNGTPFMSIIRRQTALSSLHTMNGGSMCSLISIAEPFIPMICGSSLWRVTEFIVIGRLTR